MTLKEVEMKLDNHQLQIIKYLIIDAIIIYTFIKFSDFIQFVGLPAKNIFIPLAAIFLCMMFATIGYINNYRLLKDRKRDLEV